MRPVLVYGAALRHYVKQMVALEILVFGESLIQELNLEGVALVNGDTGGVIAYALVDVVPRGNDAAFVYTLATNPGDGFRQKGYATMVIRNLVALYGEKHHLYVRLQKASEFHNAMVRLYAKVGFRHNYRPLYVNPSTASTTTTMLRRKGSYAEQQQKQRACVLL